MQVVIIDYGLGNLLSVKNMFKKIGVDATISSDFSVIKDAPKLLLPGVGAFDYGMQKIKDSGLQEVLNQKVLIDKTPILGICLGLQIMTKSSEEGVLPGLGWFNAVTKKFRLDDSSLKVPHMGWNEISIKKQSKLLDGMYDDARFYFVHSYHLDSQDASDVLLTARYGYDFVCGLEKENILGVQFHPEKSHKFGMKLLSNFIVNY
jgi:glutamine amidotransferase